MAGSDLFSLSGRVCLVTGASRGIGWGMAEGLARAGAHVVLNGRTPETLAQREKALKDQGLECSVAAFDIAALDRIPGEIARIVDRHGRLDVLVGNAGFPFRKPFPEMTLEDWRYVTTTDLDAAFVLVSEATRPMLAAGKGSVILTSSVLGSLGRANVAAYCASKGGLDAMTRSIAVELGPRGVRCNTSAPGYFETDATRVLKDNPEFFAAVCKRTPLGRWGQPPEIAGAAVFLASDASSYVNGLVLTVDGGMSAAL